MLPFRLAAGAFDILLLALLGVVLLVMFTGGGTFAVGDQRVGVSTVGNPLTAAAAVFALRLWLLPTIGPFGRLHPSLERLERATVDWMSSTFSSEAAALPVRRWFVLLVALSLGLRVSNAWHVGFLTGDDVEIHEMTFRALFDLDWEIWNLRSPLYPFSFIYPAQAAAFRIGIVDPSWLVLIGRLVVVVLATATIGLIYIAAKRLTGHSAVALLAAVLYGTSRMSLWFASTELPRPVASVLITAAFALILGTRPRAIVAGALLGLGGALRFGELVFFAPAAIHLSVERRYRDLTVCLVSGGTTALLCLALADWLYWSSPLYSLANIVDYTIVRGQSSRGFEPPWYYLSNATAWTNVPLLVLSLMAIRGEDRRAVIWAWVPVLLLSALPHKEARYVVAAQPFACIAAAQTVRRVCGAPLGSSRRRLRIVVAGALLFALAYELGNWRLQRTDDAVRLAQTIATRGARGIAAQQLWRYGGRLYWRDVPLLVELPDRPVSIEATIANNAIDSIVLIAELAPAELVAEIERAGFDRFETKSSDYLVFRRIRAD